MKQAAMLVGALALLGSVTEVAAQAPNFAGTWNLVAPAAAPDAGGGGRGGRGGGGGLGMTATITQTGTDLTINRMMGGAQVALVYKLDGSNSTNMVTPGGGGRGGAAAAPAAPVAQVSTAAWQGSRLVITTQGANGNTVMALSLNPQGQLVVETTAPGRGGGEPTTTTQTYTK